MKVKIVSVINASNLEVITNTTISALEANGQEIIDVVPINEKSVLVKYKKETID